MNKLWYINQQINAFVWGKYMVAILIGIGIVLLMKTKFLPFRHFTLIIRKTVGNLCLRNTDRTQISAFQTVSTALAGTLGVGSIIGVSTALISGGPGALFWMWMSAILGMIIKYVEVVLALVYRKKNKNEYIGGPMVTLEHGCKSKFLAVLFSIFCIFASFGIGNLAPANTVNTALQSYMSISPAVIGVVLSIVVAFIILGNSKKIMKVNETIIPIISILYLIACGYLIIVNRSNLLYAIKLIFQDAFTFRASVGGVGGFFITRAMHYGLSRGIFSHEAGMGSSPIAYASVSEGSSIEQGFWGIFEVFFDTFIVCTITALVILTSGFLGTQGNATSLVIACFEQGFGVFGGMVFTFAIISFSIPSIFGWYYYAQTCIKYIFTAPFVLRIYQAVFLILIVFGTQLDMHYVWELADTLNGLMMIPNLISIVILHKVVIKLTHNYIKRRGD